MLRLNLGCGEAKLPGFINVDAEPEIKPDLCLDFRTEPLPYEANSVDEVWILHCLEHIERRYWDRVFAEVRRVLVPRGVLVLAYPEFRVCVDYYLRDFREQRDFWLNTIFGRQFWPTDYHVTACDSIELKRYLSEQGYYRLEAKTENAPEEYNSVLIGYKAPFDVTRENIITRELGLAR